MNRGGDTAADVLLQNVGQYIEHFIDYVENVPNDIIRQISQLHEKNHRFHQCLRKLESTLAQADRRGAEEQPAAADTTAAANKRPSLAMMLQGCLTEIQSTSDEKLFLLQSIVDTLDTKARSLDHDYRCVITSMGSNAVISPLKTPDSSSSRAPHYIESSQYNSHTNSQDSADDDEAAAASEGIGGSGKHLAASSSMEFGNGDADGDDSSVVNHSTSLNERTASPPLKSPSKRGGKRSSGIGRGGARESSGRGGKRASAGKGGYGKGKEVASKRGRGSNSDNLSSLYDADQEEELYCLCRQISFGEMVACDSSSCPYEWFHLSCIGLSKAPKGKFYCPQCRGDRSNVPKK